jgi:nucleoside-diphosphate-sugar epimerase
MRLETVLVTGSKGSVGAGVVAELKRAGYRVVSVDREAGTPAAAATHRTVDLLDPEAVEGAVAESDPDAVVHLGTIPHPLDRPGHETYESNAMTTYHVLEAAAEAGVERVSLASSVNAMGAVFQEEPMDVEYLPVDEEHPVTPRDPYALGKRTIELQADGFARRVGEPSSVASFRFPFVADAAALRRWFYEPERTLASIDGESMATRNDLFAYVALEDAARAIRRGIETDLGGHERFFVSAPDTTMRTPTETLVDECYQDADGDDLSGRDPLVSTEKAKRLLGWEPERSWRDLSGTGPTAQAEVVGGQEAKE